MNESKYSLKNSLYSSLLIGGTIGLFSGFKGIIAGATFGLFTGYIVYGVTKRYIQDFLDKDDIQQNIGKISWSLYGSLLGFVISISITFIVSLLFDIISGLIIASIVGVIVGSKAVHCILKEQENIEDTKNYEKNIHDAIYVQLDVSNPLKSNFENPMKITINNPTVSPISNIQIKTNLSRLIKCDESIIKIDIIPAKSSKYTAIFITPRIADEIDLGNLNVSYDINENRYEKEPIAIGTYEAIEVTSHKPTKYTNNINSDLSISRETEFYQGFIRFKMSVTNTSSFVINDVALDFDYDNNLLRIDRREPDYQIKNDRTIFGNISANSSKTIAVYFDPMMCSKGADINCQINYKDAKGQPQTTHMKPKQISVVCPIMETEYDINIGRLKEFIEKLPYRDSKVYQIQNGFDIDALKNLSREIVQKHDVKHIRTLFAKDGNTCEIWYYGKTKVHGHDIVIKITILSETKSIELFAATETVESLAGLLAEVGRELKSAIESKVTGNVQQVINVSIKDSIVQRSNLLSHCDMDGNCSGDVVIEDSLVQRSSIGIDAEVKDSVVQRADVGGGFCTACGGAVPDGAKFCMECGEKLA